MGDALILQKTVMTDSANQFDDEVNGLIKKGYRIQKSKILSTQDSVHFVAIMTIKVRKEINDFE